MLLNALPAFQLIFGVKDPSVPWTIHASIAH
jgi:hypothetical protein